MHPRCVPLYEINTSVLACLTGLAEMRGDRRSRKPEILKGERNIEKIIAFVTS